MNTYTRGERVFFHFVDICINALSSLFLAGAYLAGAFALFATATALYAFLGFHDRVVAGQFLRFAGMMLLYVGAPLTAVTCLAIFGQQGWRTAWRARPVFVEKGLHPAFVFLLGLACCMLTYTANRSLQGHWLNLPSAVARVLDVNQARLKAGISPPRRLEAQKESEAAGPRPSQN
jgi:hypothetical protein